jgi:holo-[acyl-carrier protein] synthase
MILGLGADLCDIRRIEKVLERHGDRFIDRVFTPGERAEAERRAEKNRPSTYAKRFAAKEAASKALGTGMAGGVFFSDLDVVTMPDGKPVLVLHGGSVDRLKAITPSGMTARVHLTMTDEYPYAFAQVIIEADRDGGA